MQTFEASIASENARIAWLLDKPAFTVKKKLTKEQKDEAKKKKEARWNTANLLPCKENGDDPIEQMEYYYKELCHQAAKIITNNWKQLYFEWTLLEIYETLMLERADQW